MVFLPLKDDNPLKFIWFQFTTVTLILINIIVFVWQDSLGEAGLVKVAMNAGVIPTALLEGTAKLPPGMEYLPPEVTLVTYMFLHGDWWHLIGNMLFLWVFGDNVEDAMGSVRFLIFYILTGVAAGLAHVYANIGSEVPLIGASGATAGIVGAYLMLYPRVKMWSLAFMRLPLKLPAWVVIAAWVGTQVFFIVNQSEDGTAWWAHIGGFVAGVLLVVIFKRSDQPLFGAAPER
jgi:membrane associated rhomboid family serine protease